MTWAPSSSSSSMSWPAPALISTSWAHVPKRSVHTSTTNSCRPTSAGSMTADQRSLNPARIGTVCHPVSSPSAVAAPQRTRASSRSCPSR